MREWRNWQTRTFEGRVVHTVRVQVPFLAPADMAELADALDSGSSRGNSVKVQVLLSAPNSTNPNPKPVGEGFGFVVYFGDLNLTSGKKTKLKNGGQENESEHR